MSDFLSRLVAKAVPHGATTALAPRPDLPLPPEVITDRDVGPFDQASSIEYGSELPKRHATPGVKGLVPADTQPAWHARRFSPVEGSGRAPVVNAIEVPAPRRTEAQTGPTSSSGETVSRELAATGTRVGTITSGSDAPAVDAGSPVLPLVAAEAAPNGSHSSRAAATTRSQSVIASPPTVSLDRRGHGSNRHRSTAAPEVIPRAALDAAPAPDAAVPSRRPASAPFPPAPERDAAPSVHVTIGRLEIRVPQTPPSSPSRQQTARPGLDEYLRARARGGAR